MTLQITELFDSREAQVEPGKSSIDLRYGVFGSEDEQEVSAFITEELEIDFLGLPFQYFRMTPVGNGIWIVLAHYGSEEVREVGSSSYSFDLSDGTQHITQSLATVYSARADGVADEPPDLKGAIGVNGDSVEGVDIFGGAFSFSETHYFNDEDITNEYKIQLARMQPSVNSQPFRGFQPGEVLFRGATGSKRAALEWEITFRFSVSLNVDDFVVQGFSETPISKQGWDYLWIKYHDQVGSNSLIKRPKFLYIERVYDRYDFELLGIGG